MNPQTSVSPAAPGRPSSGVPAVFFFLPLVGLAISFVCNIVTTFFTSGAIEFGAQLSMMTAINLPIFIGALLIGLDGMKDWRRTGVLLIATSVLLSFGVHVLTELARPKVELQTYLIMVMVFNACVSLVRLAGSILLIVNKKGGSPLVRVSGLLFLCEILFTWGASFVIGWIASGIADSLEMDTSTCHRYLWLGRTLIQLGLQAIAWITLAIGVIRERSAAGA